MGSRWPSSEFHSQGRPWWLTGGLNLRMGRRERVRRAGGRVRRVPRLGSEPLPWLAGAGSIRASSRTVPWRLSNASNPVCGAVGLQVQQALVGPWPHSQDLIELALYRGLLPHLGVLQHEDHHQKPGSRSTSAVAAPKPPRQRPAGDGRPLPGEPFQSGG